MDMLTRKQIEEEIKLYYKISDVEFEKRLKQVREYINLDTRDVNSNYITHDYKNADYIYGAYCCYLDYSGSYLKILERRVLPEAKWKVKSVLDMGAGCGLTTMKLRTLFPNADIYYNQLRNTEQWKFAEYLDKKYNLNFKYIDDKEIYKKKFKLDLVMAADFFEHVFEALDLSRAVIENYNPKYWLIANAFRLPHPDHLVEFKYGDEKVAYTAISKLFNSQMRELGYEIHPITRTLWNNRPTFWRRK